MSYITQQNCKYNGNVVYDTNKIEIQREYCIQHTKIVNTTDVLYMTHAQLKLQQKCCI